MWIVYLVFVLLSLFALWLTIAIVAAYNKPASSTPPIENTTSSVTPPPPPFIVPAQFMMKNDTGSFCLDDGGSTGPGTTKFKWYDCKISNNNQHFTYDAALKQLKNVHKPSLCMDDGGSPNKGVWLHGCSTTNKNQSWDMLPDSNRKNFRFTNSNKPGLCMQADNPGANSTTFSMQPCSDSVSQLFTFASF